jgi:hypothetical protein
MTFGQGRIPCDNLRRSQRLRVRRRQLSQVFDPRWVGISAFRFWLAGGVGEDGHPARHRPKMGGLPSLALGAEGCTAMVAARLMMQNPGATSAKPLTLRILEILVAQIGNSTAT